MADCGATGSAIDQAARLIVGGNQNGARSGGNPMMVANMLEKATMAFLSHQIRPTEQQQLSSLPLISTTSIAEPDVLPLPQLLKLQEATKHQNQSQHAVLRPRTNTATIPPSPSPQPPQYHQNYYTPSAAVRPETSILNSIDYQRYQQGMLQQQSMGMLQQRQQLQQQIMWMQQQQQQQQRRISAVNMNVKEAMRSDEITQPEHDGIVQPASIQQLANAWAEVIHEKSEDDVVTTRHRNHEYDTTDLKTSHESADGANFDELASAWAEAQMEMQNEFDDLTNMWAGENLEANKYQFQNTSQDSATAKLDSTTNWMEEGYREFNAGNMNSAIQAFEMELQNMDMDNATAWCMLGKCHAENDMDALAIQCLEEAVNRDPYSMESLLSLGVSYVNELNHVSALQNLKEWILHNPKFVNLDVNGSDDMYAPSVSSSTDAAFDEVQRLLLSALDFQMHHNGNDHDTTASVLEALGVVYNVSRDYDAAIDVLQQSCALRPQDYQLWNKLGATLANSGSHRSEEALSAYHQALQIKPKYARAWLNMAIAHSNLQQYHDAARCYLQTLSINPNAVHCWSFLRIALSCIERDDLLPLATAQNLEAFKEHFDFVTYNDRQQHS